VPNKGSAFIHIENVKHFEQRLKTETDPATRKMLAKLIEEEKAALETPALPPKRRIIGV
jgi:hypothetical protein